MIFNNDDICMQCGTYAKNHFIVGTNVSVMNHIFIPMSEENKKKYYKNREHIINMINNRVCKICNLSENDHMYQMHNFEKYHLSESLNFEDKHCIRN